MASLLKLASLDCKFIKNVKICVMMKIIIALRNCLQIDYHQE